MKMGHLLQSPGVFLLLLLLITSCHGCSGTPTVCKSCKPLHPQQHFCHSDFVLQGKVLSMENVSEEDLIPKRSQKKGRAPAATTAAIAAATIAATSTLTTSTLDADVDQSKEALITTSTPPSNQQATLGVSPINDRLSLQPRSTTALSDGDLRAAHKLHGNITKYKVKINKIYKGPEWMANGHYVIIQAETAGLSCKQKYLQNDEEYLLSGSVSGGDFIHRQCDWRTSCEEMTSTLFRHLRHVYPRQCNSCQIETPIETSESQNFQVRNVSTHCIYNPRIYTDRGLLDCEGLYSACQKTKQGLCSWSRHQRMRECDSMRKKFLNYPPPVTTFPCTKTFPSTPNSHGTGERHHAPPIQNTPPGLRHSQIHSRAGKDQMEKLTSENLPLLPADKKPNSTDDNKQGTPLIFTGPTEQGASPDLHRDPPIADSPATPAQASEEPSPFSSSYVHMPDHAVALPLPPVASREAFDILQKITLQHFEKQRETAADEYRQVEISTLSPHKDAKQHSTDLKDLNKSPPLHIDLKMNSSTSEMEPVTGADVTSKKVTVHPRITVDHHQHESSESSEIGKHNMDFHYSQVALSGVDPQAHQDDFGSNPLNVPSSKPDMPDAFLHPPADHHKARDILEKIAHQVMSHKQ
ncbi:uncharacterized protein LOC110983658 [Acanthaster planci]|uniref:Uncharacterized protein LOC110983658 n=1 Tax=Acanthaster planci TaxID=133434 RepID=A0A8B7YZJ7_ACAPL|nr:uncharacterized protein LOC110983658 [Acanthaster planci]